MAVIDFDEQLEAVNDWMRDGACKGLTHLFFPSAAERPQARERRETAAKDVCASCKVRADCMAFAREQHEYGFWAENPKTNATLLASDSLRPSACGPGPYPDPGFGLRY